MIINATEIIEASAIEKVVSRFVKLDNNFKGLCPFHNEKTPSFHVHPVRGIFKCFGCGKTGNAAGFLMEHQHLTFPEALEWLAGEFHIEIQKKQGTKEEEEKYKQVYKQKQSLYILMSAAEQFFISHRSMAQEYISRRFGNNGTPDNWGIGFAPDSWIALREHLLKNQFSEELVNSSGLQVVKPDEGKAYDLFRNRVTIPIRDELGNVVAFGGRVLPEETRQPKYINSPESIIFHKGNVIFGLFAAKKAIKKEGFVNLVEGYTDVIRLHQAGAENSIAPMGTALTDEQICLIKRYASQVNLIYDGDEAGQMATKTNGMKLLEAGIRVTISVLPSGSDPDEFFKK